MGNTFFGLSRKGLGLFPYIFNILFLYFTSIQFSILAASSSPETQGRLVTLESLVIQMKDERSDLYKNQGTNVQRVLELTDKLKMMEEAMQRRDDE